MQICVIKNFAENKTNYLQKKTEIWQFVTERKQKLIQKIKLPHKVKKRKLSAINPQQIMKALVYKVTHAVSICAIIKQWGKS